MMTRISLSLALAAFAASAPLAVCADDQPMEVQIVDAMGKAFGTHPGFRANHAKGVVAEGHFVSAPGAAALSKAALFDGSTIPVTVRFSDSTGIPNLPDGAAGANPHGMAVKFHLKDGSDVDIVINSLKFFPVATGEEFRDLLNALSVSPADAPKPTPFDTFMAAHPKAPAAFASATTPESFATDEYFGVDAFVFTNTAGKQQAFRYEMLPERSAHISEADAAKRAPDFLMAELPQRLKSGAVTFHLKAQLAGAGDVTADPTQAWAADRPVVDVGTLTIDKAVADSDEAQKKLLFLPTQLTDGIEPSDDPLINVRAGSYAVSFSRRSP